MSVVNQISIRYLDFIVQFNVVALGLSMLKHCQFVGCRLRDRMSIAEIDALEVDDDSAALYISQPNPRQQSGKIYLQPQKERPRAN